jgi:YD repeat-containing protein
MNPLNLLRSGIACLMVASTLNIAAQNQQDHLSFPSPTAASLGVFGEHEVSLFTGSPKVSVPIAELKEGRLTLPIELQYRADGVKVDEHPGWVGSNWSLSSGGMITRVVKGLPDEFHLQMQGGDYPAYGFTFMGPFITGPNWSDPTTIKEFALSQNDDGSYHGIWTDTEPDEFIVNVPGLSGKFYLKPASIWFDSPNGGANYTNDLIMVGNPNVMISMEVAYECRDEDFDQSCGIRSYVTQDDFGIYDIKYKSEFITGFKLITPDAVYTFGEFRNPAIENPFQMTNAETSVDFFSKAFMGETVDTWYVKSIEVDNLAGRTPIHDKIDFEYEHLDPIASFSRSITASKESGTSTYKNFLLGWLFGNSNSASSTSISTNYSGRIIWPVYLKKISTRTQEVEFTKSVTVEKRYNFEGVVSHLASVIHEGAGGYSTIYTPAPLNYGSYVENPQFLFTNEVLDEISVPSSYFGRPEVYKIFRWDMNADNQYTCGQYDNNGNCILYDIANPIPQYIDFSTFKWHQLDKITIKEKGSSNQKAFEFSYSANPNEQLRLLRVRESDNQGKYLPPFLFEYENYDNTLTSAGESRQQAGNTRKLPNYLSYTADHWGYYNGADDPASSKNSFIINFDDEATLGAGFYNFRNPDPNYLYSGILNKVTYPTGGYSSFYYEPHSCTKMVSRANDGTFSLTALASPRTLGGLRVKKIETFNDNGSVARKKEYQYEEGILGGDAQYLWKDYEIDMYYFDVPARNYKKSTNITKYTSSRFMTHSVLPMSTTSMGGYIGYGKVIEKETGIGRTEYYFTNHGDAITGAAEYLDEKYLNTINLGAKTRYTPFNSIEMKRGLLKRIEVYNESNLKVRQEVNTFKLNTPGVDREFVHAMEIHRLSTPLCGTCVAIEGTAYKNYIYSFLIGSTEVSVYDNGANPVVTTTTYNYNFLDLVSTKSVKGSDGKTYSTKYRYRTDVINTQITTSPTDEEALAILKMVTFDAALTPVVFKTNAPIEIIESADGRFYRATLQTFKEFPVSGYTEPTNILPFANSQYEVTEGRISYTEFMINSNGTITKDINLKPFSTTSDYEGYSGNPREFRFDNDLTTSYVWGYESTLPIAKVENASRNQILYTSFEDLSSGFSTTAKTGSKSKSGTYTVVIPSAGTYKLTYWRKSGTGAWLLTETNISSNITIGGSGILVDEVRLHPASAMMTSYTYQPMFGVTSMTDPNNKITYYEYDSFGRLKTVRDGDMNILKQYDYNYKTNP